MFTTDSSHITRRHLLGTAGALALMPATRLLANDSDTATQLLPVKTITHGPANHFFGYYDKCPWDATGRYLLAMRIGFYDRNPKLGEKLGVGLIDLQQNNTYTPLDETPAWSWQQGTMLQWVGDSNDIIYNTVDKGRYVATVVNAKTRKKRLLPQSIYAISRDGSQAVTLDYERVNRLRPGYGYIALPENDADDLAPKNKGIYRMDLKTSEAKLILSLAWAAQVNPDERFKDAVHWFNHLQFNPSGTRFIFLHRWRTPKKTNWFTRLYTAKSDGSDPRLLSDVGMVSHFDWRDDNTILAWTTTKDRGTHFYLVDALTGQHDVFAADAFTRDGHCSYSPDRKWILCDTYPDKEHKQALMLYRISDGRFFLIGRFLQPAAIHHKPYRCDLHPRWNRDGTEVCIDSTHEGTRQLYTLDVSAIVRTQT